jgi:hypothetical protein
VSHKTSIAIVAIWIAAGAVVYGLCASQGPTISEMNNLGQKAATGRMLTQPALWKLVSENETTRNTHFDDLNASQWTSWEEEAATNQTDFFIAGVLTGDKAANIGSQDRLTNHQVMRSRLDPVSNERQFATGIN